jgi:hypothetical protein
LNIYTAGTCRYSPLIYIHIYRERKREREP